MIYNIPVRCFYNQQLGDANFRRTSQDIFFAKHNWNGISVF